LLEHIISFFFFFAWHNLIEWFMGLDIYQKVKTVKDLLEAEYPDVSTPLIHKNAWELLVAVILSAQTLDATVNKVSPLLFDRFPNCEVLSNAKLKEVERIIKPVNYYKTKAKNIIKVSQILREQFGSVVPSSLEDLVALPGVGRKTANVVINEWFCKHYPNFEPEGFVVDTHVMRVSKRLGFSNHSDPIKIEQDLMRLFDKKDWGNMSLRLIFHGRYRCMAQKNLCCEHETWSKLCSC
jgi:endonuclease-3